MTIEKEAQGRSITNMLGRALNPMEWVRYYGFSEYRRLYDAVTELDTSMRAAVKERDPDIRTSLHEARMAMKNREFPKVLYYALKLIQSVDGIFDVSKIEEITSEIFTKEQEASQSSITDEQRQEMEEALGERPLQGQAQFPTEASLEILLRASAVPELISEAGAIQWLQENIPTAKQMKGNILDRIFRNKAGKQKEAAKEALRLAEQAYSSIKTLFDKLDAARTDFNKYISTVKYYQGLFAKYKGRLSALYQANFSGIVPAKKEVSEAPPAETPATTAPPVEAPPATAPAPAPATTPAKAPAKPKRRQKKPEMASAAEVVIDLVGRAKLAAKDGDFGIASALLVKASEIYDHYDNEEKSIELLIAAEKLLKGGDE